MDLTEIAKKLGLSESNQVIRKAAELRRLSDLQFNSSVLGIGEICKAIICLEIAATREDVMFDRQNAIKLSGMSEKAYIRSFNAMQNGLDLKNKLDIRELAIQFGCIRLIPIVQKGLLLFRDRFLASLPASRRATVDFNRPVFLATAFYLCAKQHKVATSMKDLCHDLFGISKEKKDPKTVKGNRALLDALLEKRSVEDGGYSSDEGKELSSYKKRKQEEKRDYEDWKSKVITSNKS